MTPTGSPLGSRTVAFSLSVSVSSIAEYFKCMGFQDVSSTEARYLQALQNALLATPKTLAAWLDVLGFYAVGHFYAKDLHEDDYATQDAALFSLVRGLLPGLAPTVRAYWEPRLRSPAWCQSDAGVALVLSFDVKVESSTPPSPPFVEAGTFGEDDEDAAPPAAQKTKKKSANTKTTPATKAPAKKAKTQKKTPAAKESLPPPAVSTKTKEKPATKAKKQPAAATQKAKT